MTREQKGKIATWIGTLATIATLFVGLVAFAVRADSAASAALSQVKEQEVRLRTLEQTLPRIDEKLTSIEKLLIDHKRQTEGKVKP